MKHAGLRRGASIAGGIVVALALFLLMTVLIEGGQGQPGTATAGQIVDLIHVQEEDKVRRTVRVRPKMPPRKEPPPPVRITRSSVIEPQREPIRIDLPTIGVSRGGPIIGPWKPGAPAAEGEAIPIQRVDPQYPQQALMDGAEGYVNFEVLIGTDGTVLEVRVTEAAPGRIFVHSAVRAVRRWKFKPRVVDGVPVERWARTSIVFELDN
jgi:protein TonB